MKENSIEEDIKNIEEIIELSKEEIDAKTEYIIAILDIEDLISLEHILSDYKKILKENESWKSYSEEIEEEQIEKSNKNCELEFEVEKLQKKNDELKKLMAHKNWYTQKLEEDLFENASNYVIKKQKVKDKIEELSKTKGDLATHIAVSERIRALQEILEESEGSKDGEN